MGGGGGGGGNDGVEYQREQEEARQARIRDGMSRINAIFDGTDVIHPTGQALNPNVSGIGNGRYYDASGKAYDLQNGNHGNLRWGGVKRANIGVPGARVQTAINGQWQDLPTQLYSGYTTTREGGFGDDYFNNRAKAYTEYALPQLQDQYQDQQKALAFALSRGGNLGSSVAASKTAELDKDYSLQQQNVYDKGQDYVNQGKADLNTQKQNLVSMLQASADPDATANLAQASAQSLATMPTFSPLSPVISNVASGLGTYLTNQQTADAVRNAYQNSYTNPLSRSSGKVG
jgi:hypothetical protein